MDETTVPLDTGLESLDYAAIVLYLVVTFGIALWFGRKQKNTEDFFVGGRRMPWFAVGLSILATLFSTLSYLGVPGEMIRRGIGLFAGYLAVPFSMAVVALLWIPFFMRLRLTSAYEYLERRFSYAVRLLGATLFILLRLGWMSMVIYAASNALDGVKGGDLHDVAWLPGKDIYWWVAFIGIFAAIYTAVGGIQAMIWTDVLQCFLLLAGVLMAIFYVLLVDHTGPLDWWRIATAEAPQHTSPPLFSWDITVRNTIFFTVIGNFFWTICTHGSDQVVLQRYFSTASLKAARRSYFINVGVDLMMASLLSLAGLALLAYYLRHQSLSPSGGTVVEAADKLFPHFLGSQLPAGCAGLVIAAFLCDAMQTLESGVNAITAVVTNDVVPRLRQGRPRLMSDLTFARMMSVLITAIVSANAFFVANLALTQKKTLVDMMPQFFNMFVGPLAGMFIVGMFFSRCTTRSVLPAALVGLTVSVLWSWYKEIFDKPIGPTIFLAIAVPTLTTISIAALLGWLVESGEPHAGQAYTWRSIVRGMPEPGEAD